MADDKPVGGMTPEEQRLADLYGPQARGTFWEDLKTHRAPLIDALREQRLGSYLVDEGEKIWDAIPKPWENPDTTQAVLDVAALPAKAAVGMAKGIGSIMEAAVTNPTVETAADAAFAVAGVGGGLSALGVGAKQARSLGMFVGRNAENADLSKLATAEKMALKGHSREEIYDQTGWFRWQRPIVGPDGKRVIGPDGKPVTEPISDWRFETPDADSYGHVNPEVLTETGQTKVPVFRLEKIFEHPKLAKSYSGRPPGAMPVPAPASGAASSGAAMAAIMKQRLELSAELKALKGSGLDAKDPKYEAAYQKLQDRDKALLDEYIVEYNKAKALSPAAVKETELGPVETPAGAGSATSPPEWTENVFDTAQGAYGTGIDTSKLGSPIMERLARKVDYSGSSTAASYNPYSDSFNFGTLPGNAAKDGWVPWDKKGEYTQKLRPDVLEKNRKAAEKVFKKAGVSLDTAGALFGSDAPVHSLRHWKTDRKLSKEEQARLFETTPEAEEAWRLVHKRENTFYEKDDLALTRFWGSALHELQHAIQAREGWQGGGNTKMFGKGGPPRYQGNVKDPYTGARLTNKEKYYRLLGEIEARLADRRKDLPDAERYSVQKRPWTREGGLDRLESQAIVEKDFADGGPVYGSSIQYMADGGPPKPPVDVSQEANDLIAAAGINNEYEEVVSWFANEWRDGAIGSYFTEQELENGAHYDEARTIINEDPTFAVAEYKSAVVPEPEPRPEDPSNLPALISEAATAVQRTLPPADESRPKGQTGVGRAAGIAGGVLRRAPIGVLAQAAQFGYERFLSEEQKAAVKEFLASPAHEFVGLEKPGIEYFKDLFGMSETEPQGEGLPALAEEARDLTSGPRPTDQVDLSQIGNPLKDGQPLGPIYDLVPKEQIPIETRRVYKLVKLLPSRPGLVFPLYAKPVGPSQGFITGQWFRAKVQVPKIGGKELAPRSGIHSMVLPVFDQGTAQAAGDTRVWMEVEIPVINKGTQIESDTSEVLDNGQRKGIRDRLIDADESYDFKTNPASSIDAGGWPISGSARFVRVVPDQEIASVLLENNLDHQIENSTTGIDDSRAAELNSEMGSVAASTSKYFQSETRAQLPMDQASRMARAKEMGFDVDLYHGSRAMGDEGVHISGEFDDRGLGVHFGTSEQASNRLRQTRRERGLEGENILPLKVRIKNPIELPDAGEHDNPLVVAEAYLKTDFGRRNQDALSEILSEAEDLAPQFEDIDAWKASPEAEELLQDIQRLIIDEGHDSIRYRNVVENQYGDLTGFTREGQQQYDTLNKEYHELRKTIAQRDAPPPELGATAEEVLAWADRGQPKATAAEAARFDEIAAATKRLEGTSRNSPYSYILFDTKNIRSRSAKFDPAKKDRAGLDFAAGGFVDKPLYDNNTIVGL